MLGEKNHRTLVTVAIRELKAVYTCKTCWVAAGGGDVNAWIKKLEGRLDILHLKDITMIRDAQGNLLPTMTKIGKGNLDWNSILNTAQRYGVKHYVVEQDSNFTVSPINSVQISAEYLNSILG